MAPVLTFGEDVLDRDALLGLLEPMGSTSTVYLPSPSDRVDADDRLAVHWKDAARRLTDDGADPADVGALEQAISGEHRGGNTVVAIATGGEVRAFGHLDQPIDRPHVEVAPLPALLPVLAWDQGRIPHVVVVADRVGADLVAVSPVERDRATTVDGDELHIHRGAPGGWSQRRFQQRAENQWESNAAAVAEQVARLVDEVSAEAVVVAGDERALGFLREHLPRRIDAMVRAIPGSRAEWSEDRIADETVRQIADASAEHMMTELDDFGDAVGAGTAVEGADAVCEGLRQARIDRLYVTDDTADADRPSAWTAEDPAFLFPGAARPDLDVPTRRVALHDAAARAAVLTGAGVVVVPAHGRHAPADGLGGLLRGSTTRT